MMSFSSKLAVYFSATFCPFTFCGISFNSVLTSMPFESVQFTKLYPGLGVAVEPVAVPVVGAIDSNEALTFPPAVAL